MKKLIILAISTFILSGCASGEKMIDQKKQSIPTQGVHHIGLTVKDLSLTSKFFINALNFKQVGEKPDYPAIFVSDGNLMITLWQVSDKKTAVAFDRKNNIGLHHLALKLKNFEDLDAMYERLKDWPGVKFQFPPELMGKGPGKHMMLYEPSGVRIEFAASPE